MCNRYNRHIIFNSIIPNLEQKEQKGNKMEAGSSDCSYFRGMGMPPKRKDSLSRVSPGTKRVRELRAAETPEQRDARPEQNRIRNAETRAAETTEQRDARLEKNRLRNAELRVAETSEQRGARVEENRMRMAEGRATETPEPREARTAENRLRMAEARAAETSEMTAVIVDEEFDSRDVVIQKRNDALQRISETHRSHGALQYPVIFWEGSDMAVFRLESENGVLDEIIQYLMGRYINSNEALWHILRFAIHERYTAVVHLSVHLENGQRVYFTSGNAHEKAENSLNTTLTAFFLCANRILLLGHYFTQKSQNITPGTCQGKCFARENKVFQFQVMCVQAMP
ncbi:hypothetical protein ANCCEY_12816 [Ancylostoma ceylanicum]|uniref:Uncharacterized protein n=1 Tax=Ancylostoma ceylanicum TaxID=53326 RepID=A0A0D6L8D6_9BILA|nr:hypothetical protein ANCCEY_12816 [Ancylostoma ceylanicum]